MPDAVQSGGHWRSLRRAFELIDQPFRLATNLTFLGILGSLIGAYVQYNSWWNEKNLARYREELTSAIASYAEISGQISSMINLQQMMYYAYKNAFDHWGPRDQESKLFLTRNGKKTYDDYVISRTALRKQVDVLLGKADLFIDRPISSDSRRIEAFEERILVISDRDSLRDAKFSCKQHMPDLSMPKLAIAQTIINWNSAKDHVGTLYYCLEEIHTALLPVRIWAEAGAIPIISESAELSTRHTEFKKRMPDVEIDMALLTTRLRSFISLSTRNIETIRLRIRPGFLRYMFCWYC